MQRRWWQILLLVVLAVVLVWTSADDDSGPVAETPSATSSASAPVDDLPPQVAETVALIDDGGPFPYDRDDVVFENREGLLPQQPRGYYREYTVPTPGEDDRGARRLVEGENGELFYTDDHYASFEQIRGRS